MGLFFSKKREALQGYEVPCQGRDHRDTCPNWYRARCCVFRFVRDQRAEQQRALEHGNAEARPGSDPTDRTRRNH